MLLFYKLLYPKLSDKILISVGFFVCEERVILSPVFKRRIEFRTNEFVTQGTQLKIFIRYTTRNEATGWVFGVEI